MTADRVRIAPSPTGPLHIGTARTALFNFLHARHVGGTFVLRLEDTDQARGSLAYEQDILDGLHWLGLEWDEGPEVAGDASRGPYAPYRQMQRLPLYAEAAERLLATDQAYRCYCLPEQLDADRKAQEAAKLPPKYVGRCAHLTADERAAFEAEGRRGALRFRVGEGVVAFDDIVRGRVEIDVSNLGGDFVIVRGDGNPLYHFTVVVDDAAMAISHVIRGEDHLSNTPKHILLFRALGHEVPRFAHLPLILNADRTKMSKRKSQTAMRDYIDQGFIREALVNYLALLGWSTGTEEEVLSVDEIIERFDIDAIHKGGAVFDRERLEWLNGQWIRRLDPDDLIDRLRPFIEAELAAGRIGWMPVDDEIRALLPVVQERLPTLGAIGDLVGFLWVDDVAVEPAVLVPKRWDAATTREGSLGRARGHRRRPRSDIRSGRARTAPACARRGSRLEGRRPLHGDPCRGHRTDRHATAVRHAGGPGPDPDARADRPGARGARGGVSSAAMAVAETCQVLTGTPARLSGDPDQGGSVTHDDVQRWLDRYVEAWRTYDPAVIGDLFSVDATYRYQPYNPPVIGRDAILEDWLSSPDKPDSWEAHYQPFAVDGDRAVAIGESRYVKPDGSLRDLYYNLWTLRFDADGRCAEFVEYFMALPEARKGG